MKKFQTCIFHAVYRPIYGNADPLLAEERGPGLRQGIRGSSAQVTPLLLTFGYNFWLMFVTCLSTQMHLYSSKRISHGWVNDWNMLLFKVSPQQGDFEHHTYSKLIPLKTDACQIKPIQVLSTANSPPDANIKFNPWLTNFPIIIFFPQKCSK